MNSNQIINIPVDEVIPYENNPRNNAEAVAYVKRSILKFGFRQPIIINQGNVIICGHTRLLAAKELGMTEVPCIKVEDLSEDEVRAFRLADNKVAEMSTWNWDKLEQELGAIDMSLLDFDMSDFGFDSDKHDQADYDDFWEEGSAGSKEETEEQDEPDDEIVCPHCGQSFKP